MLEDTQELLLCYHMTESLMATWLFAVHRGRPSLTRHLGQCTWLTPLRTWEPLTQEHSLLRGRRKAKRVISDDFSVGLPLLRMSCELQPCILQTVRGEHR